ncbi:MAG: pitrilysin family protein [Bacillota bacterium]|jgi:predicted Zn-dependent peptidase
MVTKKIVRWSLGLALLISCFPLVAGAAPKENFTTVVLKNGITVKYKVMKGQPKVSMYAVFPIGMNYDKAKGIAHLTEHLAFRGGSNYTYHEIAAETIRQGGLFNGFTSFYNTAYNYVVPKDNFAAAFKVFNASLWQTTLNVTNMEMEKKIIVYELDMGYASQYAYYPIIRYFYPDMYHSKETLAEITVADLQEFHRTYYRPGNATYIIAGDFDPQAACAVLEEIQDPAVGKPQRSNLREAKALNFHQGEQVEERNLTPYHYQILMAYDLGGLTAKERMVLKLLSYIYGSDWKIDYQENKYKIYNMVARTVGVRDYFGIYYLERSLPFTEENYRAEKENMQNYIHEFKKIDFRRQVKNFIKLIKRERVKSQATAESAVNYEVQRLTDPDSINVDSLATLKSLKKRDLDNVIAKYLSKPPTTWILVKNKPGGKAK